MSKLKRPRLPFVLLFVASLLLAGAYTQYHRQLKQRENDLIAAYSKIDLPSYLGSPDTTTCPKRMYLSENANCTFVYLLDMQRSEAFLSMENRLKEPPLILSSDHVPDHVPDIPHEWLDETFLSAQELNYAFYFTFNPVQDDYRKPPSEKITDITVHVFEKDKP